MAGKAFHELKAWARRIKRDVVALWLAARDPRVPLAAKIVAGLVAAYALSPVDLIPDFIPIIGYLDDLILLPAGLYLILWMVPAPVLAECRAQATEWLGSRRPQPRSLPAAIIVLLLWIALCVWLWQRYGEQLLQFSGLR